VSTNTDAAAKPLRVLHIGKYFPPHRGGMETFLRDLMAEQQRQGLSVRALVHGSERGLRSITEVREEQGERLRVTRAARWVTAAFAPISPTFPLVLSRELREFRPDILHIHMPNLSAFWCLFVPGARRVPWVVHWHADVLASTRSRALRYLYWLYRPFEQALLGRAARIIATSPPYLESSEPLAGHRERCTVVPLGICDLPHAEFEAPPDATGLRVLCVGRLTYYKGVRYLIDAVVSLENITLTIVGSGDEEADLRALVRDRGAADRIHFAGNLPDDALHGELAHCDCLCLPSVERTEAFGVVLLEAMCAGRATVATKVPGSGMSCVVEEGVTGLLVAPEDGHALAHALQTLRDDPETWEQMGRAGRMRFNEFFRIDRTTGILGALYNAVAG
jgi:rhamnosyl/mannosyltransferase